MVKSVKILIVDDDLDLLVLIKRVLESESYKVVTADNGEDGLSKILIEKPDLIILDVVMPKMNGFDVCRELRENSEYNAFSNIPIILLTAYPDNRQGTNLTLQEGMTMEADDYIQKPIKMEKLIERVRRLL